MGENCVNVTEEGRKEGTKKGGGGGGAPPPPYIGHAPLGKGGGDEGVGENCVNGTEGEKGGGGAISL